MRLGFSVAMHIQPDVLLLDEVLAVGDEAFQQKCYGKIGDFKRGGGTIVFVSHDPGAVERLCDQAVLLDHGRSVERGPAGDVVRAYHRRLVSSSQESAGDREGRVGGPVRVHEVRAVAGDGSVRDRFTEGEPMALEVWLYAEDGLDDARVTLGLRDSGDRTARHADALTRSASDPAGSSGCGSTSRGCRCARAASTSTSAWRRATATRSSTTPSARSSSASSARTPAAAARFASAARGSYPPSTEPATGNVNRMEPLLVRAARREPVERTPVWFMRQAGRSLPEYRELRKQYGLFEIARQPELCAEVTLQPVRRHDVDAAVMFADIMLPVLGMGVEVELVENVGPVIAAPIRSLADVERLVVPVPEESVPWTLESVRLVREALRQDQAVVGFAGGPFTVAGYLIEGKPSREFKLTKACMYSQPEVWHALMEKLADAFALYVAACAGAGADAIQLFDSWAGALSVADYREFVAPYSARVLEAVDVPTIHFATGDAHLLEERAAVGGDVIGVDWRVPLDVAWERIGHDRGIQGNLDGAVLLGPWERVEEGTRRVLEEAGGRPGHIFNLGHGVLPETDPELLGRLVGSCTRRPWCRHERRGDPDGVRQPGDGRRHPARTSRTCAAAGRSPTRRSPSSPSATGGSAGARRSTR